MLVNRNNAHTGGFLSSNQGLLQGCGGCSCQPHSVVPPASTACGIVQGHGIVGQHGGAIGVDGKPTYPNSQGNFPTAKDQAGAARRGTRSFLAGVAGRQSGGGYGMTGKAAGAAARGGLGYGRPPSVQHTDCGLIPAFKHGAGSVHALGQKGGASLVDRLNQTGASGYAYLPKDSKYNALVAGSGYPVVTATTRRQCVGGGRRRRRRKGRRKARRTRRRRRTRRKRGGSLFRGLGWNIKHANLSMLPSSAGPGFTGQSAGRRRSRRRRGGRGLGWDIEHANLSMLPSSAGPGFTGQSAGRRRKRTRRARRRRTSCKCRRRCRSRRRCPSRRVRRRRRRRRTQRGGYHQYQSNVPLARTMVTPNGPAGGAWPGQLAQPPTYKIIDTCVDNYNHFKGKGHPTGVFDGAAPPVPFGGAGGTPSRP